MSSEGVGETRRALGRAATAMPIKIAIVAMGGEGGGVLADWIVATAEHAGFYAQTTSVPGVAQRTGATIYYLEILPVPRSSHPPPVLGLMPVPGDVDIVLASELMESARAVQRGLVTSDKTLLIASSNRVYALPEKMAMGDGRKDPQALFNVSQQAAREFVCCDFAALAVQHGSVISAPLFGALAASQSLPLTRQDFEATIARSGVSVDASLAAFAAGWQACGDARQTAQQTTEPPTVPSGAELAAASTGPVCLDGVDLSDPRLAGPLHRLPHEFSLHEKLPVYRVLLLGAVRMLDYQDVYYADEYLDLVRPIADLDEGLPQHGWRLLEATARHLALWMTYEDTIRVAELKIRKRRFERVQREHQGNKGAQLLHIHDFFHPRAEEIADTLPAGLGRWLLGTKWAHGLVQRATCKGRVIRSNRLGGFLTLYALASLRGLRRRSLRHQRESAAIRDWLALIEAHVRINYDLACEIAACQTLIKGYGDTHARGWANWQRIAAALPALATRDDAAQCVAALRQAALEDEDGNALAALLGKFGAKPDAQRLPPTPSFPPTDAP